MTTGERRNDLQPDSAVRFSCIARSSIRAGRTESAAARAGVRAASSMDAIRSLLRFDRCRSASRRALTSTELSSPASCSIAAFSLADTPSVSSREQLFDAVRIFGKCRRRAFRSSSSSLPLSSKLMPTRPATRTGRRRRTARRELGSKIGFDPQRRVVPNRMPVVKSTLR